MARTGYTPCAEYYHEDKNPELVTTPCMYKRTIAVIFQ